MASKIGIFDSERHAVNAVQQLLQAGFTTGELRVIAKDGYHSRILEAECGMHVDELRDIVDATGNHSDGYSNGDFRQSSLIGTSVAAAGIAFGSMYYAGGMPYAAASYLAAVRTDGNESTYDRILSSLGVEDEKLDQCRTAVQNGAIAVMAATTESKTLLEVDGGPELSVLSNAEAIYRATGATQII
ncbi:heat induced stress protein YflT [Paenibacillus cellulosilyticus]|uniref:Heat induced stress protein YflT n=1 Tax=Paenibacillus cellulosilyticus TaxID=375489 RepID=A0A2V2YKW8_9BACL|nr:general stress protein [Paenibacillus cellulosilyticus]PWV94252.1 heat induced stress protein YflT [Paenibacillus cellulosilyticus]QKS44257.1 general stress protein [Paenibacillus cellulosilyticus]